MATPLRLAILPGSILFALSSAWIHPAALDGQSVVVGAVVERSTAEPIHGVFVGLMDPTGRRVAGVLTDQTGIFRLRAPASGPYTLRADRIGFGAAESPLLEVGAGTVTYRFELDSRPIQIEGVTADVASRQCRVRPEDGSRLHGIWERVRVALDVAVWTDQSGYLRSHQRTYERWTDPVSGRIQDEVEWGRTRTGRVGFATAPAQELMADGFVWPDGDGYVFHGLDAATILSDDFLDAHCFQLRAPGRGQEGLVGLAFEPVRGRTQPGVHGVLWLDAESSELRSLEYGYTWVPWRLPPEPFGGETAFRRLPSGAWIVERWSIRMPQIEREVPTTWVTALGRRPSTREVLTRLRNEAGLLIKEEGGEVAALVTADGVRLPGAERAALQGVVHDSIGGGPLPGARVRLEGTAYETETDARGRYHLGDLPAGVYAVAFEHAVLDDLELALPAREVALERGDVTVRDLAVPSLATVLALDCPPGAADAAGEPQAAGPAAGPVVGQVLNGTTGEPLAAAAVSLRLPDRESAPVLETWTDAAGVFRFCDVPAHGPAVLNAEFMDRAWARATLDVSPAAPVYHVLTLRMEAPSRLTGQVVDAETGEPIGGATVRLEGVHPARVTRADGRFVFLELPPGDYALEAGHLAYHTVEDTVTVDGAGTQLQVDVRLAVGAIPLDPIVVSVAARPMSGSLGPVYDRIERVRLSGGGTVFDRADIERRNASQFTHFIGEVRSVRIESLGSVPIISSTRAFSGFSPMCPMTVWVDGTMVVRGGVAAGVDRGSDDRGIDQMIRMADIEAIEVYHVSDRIPPEYWGSASGCGVVLIWTRRER